MQYYGYTAWLRGHAYSRLTMDPCNQVYAAWLVAIAGSRRKELGANYSERLGDMVENALAICWLIDEYPLDLGHLLGDPNAMWGRLEEFIRMSMINKLQNQFDFGARKLQRPKTHTWHARIGHPEGNELARM
jgi:hypothetical protein